MKIYFQDFDENSNADFDRDLQVNNEMIVSDENVDCENVDVIAKVDASQDSDSFVENKWQLNRTIADGHGSNNDNLHRNPNSKIKGFQRDERKNIVCLDCGKCFKHKNSYNCHKRM